ncbi:MAG TPA: ABC transporter permease [Anaeromyxobacteraceae bacterium]|nr:ABC transporter permease [Anaeromyxobacteraceae bacterium]
MRRSLVHLGKSVLLPAAVIILWEALSRAGRLSPAILPAPSQVLSRLWHYLAPQEPFDRAHEGWLAWLVSGELPQDALGSLFRVTLGFLIGGGMALPLGLLMGRKPLAQELLGPALEVLRPIPPIAFIPLSILWFGLGNPPALFLIALGAFFPVLVNTVAGVRHVDSIYIRAAQNLGANEATLFRRIIIPGAMPHILTGMRVGIGVAFIVVIVAEMTAVNRGLGYRILEAREFMWSDKIIAGMITIGLCGLGIDTFMNRLNRRLLRWHRGMENA